MKRYSAGSMRAGPHRMMDIYGCLRPWQAPSQNSTRNFFVFALVVLWSIYALNRSLNGLEIISDEYYYLNEAIDGAVKRRYFLHLVQSFSNWELAQLVVSVINLFAVVLSFILMCRVNFNNYTATFFQLFYFAAIANYLFRDSILLLLFAALTLAVFSKKVWYIALASPLLIGLYDFRPHFLILFLAAVVCGLVVARIKSNLVLIVLGLVCLGLATSVAATLGNEYKIHNITLSEYIASREERHNYTLTPLTFAYGFIKHYLAPIPTSLIKRMVFGSEFRIETSIYGSLDDIYRFVYKTFIYFVVVYLVLNFRRVIVIFDRWRFEAAFLGVFCLSNAALYTVFAYGNGHERVKIFSTIFLVFLYAGVVYIKKEAQVLIKRGA